MKLAFHYKIQFYLRTLEKLYKLKKPHQLYFRFNKYNHYFECLSDDIKEHAIQTAKKIKQAHFRSLKNRYGLSRKSALKINSYLVRL